LEKLWGLKLGKPGSKEAYTLKWIIAALSDFNGQIQARDIVRLIRFACENALELKEYPGRLLPPAAVKNALNPCSEKKIEEIKQEITILEAIFAKLERIPEQDHISMKKQKRFSRVQLHTIWMNASPSQTENFSVLRTENCQLFCPVGTFENSPAIHCRERNLSKIASHRDAWKKRHIPNRPYGTEYRGGLPIPAMNCRAILKSPYGLNN
jgi:hypothetical protein